MTSQKKKKQRYRHLRKGRGWPMVFHDQYWKGEVLDGKPTGHPGGEAKRTMRK